jgi:hypothetical protein
MPFYPTLHLTEGVRSESELEKKPHESKYYDFLFQPSDLNQIKHSQSFNEIVMNVQDDDNYIRNPTITFKPSKFGPRKLILAPNQQYKNIEVENSLKISHFLQRELMKNAETGEVLTLQEDLLKKLGPIF